MALSLYKRIALESIREKTLDELGDLGDRMQIGLPFAQGGAVGSANFDSYSSPESSQNPDQFNYPHSSDSVSNITLAPPEDYDNSPKPQNPQDFDRDVDAIKHVVTPDEILAGMQAELRKSVFKRKDAAKQKVVANLKKDPKYYSSLRCMGIEDNLEEKTTIKIDERQSRLNLLKKMEQDRYDKYKLTWR